MQQAFNGHNMRRRKSKKAKLSVLIIQCTFLIQSFVLNLKMPTVVVFRVIIFVEKMCVDEQKLMLNWLKEKDKQKRKKNQV